MSKYQWPEDLQDEIVRYFETKMLSYNKNNMTLAWEASINRKIRPYPNYRQIKQDCCYICGYTDCDKQGEGLYPSFRVCDNFKESEE